MAVPRAERRRPIITSGGLLRAITSLLTVLSFGAIAYFAAGHVYEASAPLQPSAPASVLAASGVAPDPTAAPIQRDRRTFISPQVPTTTSRVPVTRTRQSG